MRAPRRFWEGLSATLSACKPTPHTHPCTEVDREELDRQIANMYRDVANETAADLHFPTERPLAEGLGYPDDLLTRLPAQAVNSFAGVGYHLGVARLLQGERVLDLGGDSGMDVFAAATQVGPAGAVTGVDITPEQLAKAERLRRGQHARFRTRADRGTAIRRRLGRRRDSKRRGQPLGGQAPGVRRGGAGAPAGWTARASRHRD